MAKEKNKTELPEVVEGELQARLIKLREEAGYDIPQMADALCLSEEVIVNLENEAFDLLPEPPYVRGYLRNYAKLSEEDSSELIKRYEALRGADADELDFQIKASTTLKNEQKKHISPVWTQLIMLAILLGGISYASTVPEIKTWFTEKWQSFSAQLDPATAENNPSLLGDLPVPTPLPEEEINTAANTQVLTTNTETTPSAEEASTPTATTETETVATIETTSTTTEQATATETTEESETQTTTETETTTNETATETVSTAESATETETVAATSSDTINIKLVFNNEVWLRIRDKESKTVFEGLNKEGTEKTIDLQKPLTFRVGNAQGLSLFIDGKAVDISSYINGSIANFTLE